MIGMRNDARHPSHEELLLVADREASPRKAAKIREHLAQCAPCHAQMDAIEKTLADFILLHEERVQAQPPSAGSRAMLKARLSAVAHEARSSESWLSSLLTRQLAGACIALLIVAGSIWSMREIALHLGEENASGQLADALPRKRLTPGATRAVRLDDLCRNQDIEGLQPLNASLEQQVFNEYGLPVSSRPHYEVDYLITPELGGSTDIHNLWPEPYSSTSWNAHVKDELENHLHNMVCQGKVPLTTAQEDIATDWIAAYKRYFHTDAPLSNAATLAAEPAKRPELSARQVPYL